MSAPLKSPVLARTSSAASGLRFCGMIELPVVKASVSRIKPKASLDQMTTSSAKRDRCVPASAAAARNSTAKSRSETASIEFAAGRSKPSAAAVRSRSIGKAVPASAAAPSGDSLSRRRQSAKRPRSRPSGMQSARHRPDQLGEPCLDIEVDVLVLVAEDKAPRLHLAEDLL